MPRVRITTRNVMSRIGKLFSLKSILVLLLMVCVYNVGRLSSPCVQCDKVSSDQAAYGLAPAAHVNRDIRMQKEQFLRPETMTDKSKPKETVVASHSDRIPPFPPSRAAEPQIQLQQQFEQRAKPASEHAQPAAAVVQNVHSSSKEDKPKVYNYGERKSPTSKPLSSNQTRLYLPKDYYGTGSIAHHAGLKRLGAESISKHHFKSPFVVDPHIYSRSTIRKPPGNRKLKTISCYNCPERFYISHKYNNDFQQCPYSECRLTSTDGMNTDADVMIFWQDPGVSPPTKPKHQIWVDMGWESPPHRSYAQPSHLWVNKFNWTISYRMDADFQLPYDQLFWRDRSLLKPDSFYLEMAKRKTKMATWWVSHCQTRSHREQYVKELQKHIEVDIYGACGNLTCERDLASSCHKMLNESYRFYLSFENSFCIDYVTEKFFKMFRHRFNIIPVVRGSFNYEKYIPPNIFINADKFPSPEALAKHLKALAKDDNLYAKMLKEKDKLGDVNRKMDWCDFCEKLHTGKFKTRVIGNVKDFINEGGRCWDRVIKD